jgi:uncharacterized membrane protein YsdA (DUF1294 family)/cold shock CspA family protein
MAEILNARLVLWHPDKGYGFLQVGAQRVFLHVNQLKAGHPTPRVNAFFEFSLGRDAEGRTCAVDAREVGWNAPVGPLRPAQTPVKGRVSDPRMVPSRPSKERRSRPSREHRLHADHVVFLLFLLMAPGLALHRLDWSPLTLGISAVALSAVTYMTYALDKMRAQSGDWRIPETTLHMLSLLGGWPGAFLAQQRIRHKTAKTSFQVVFWLTVLSWQVVALDYLLGWRMSNAAAALVGQWVG